MVTKKGGDSSTAIKPDVVNSDERDNYLFILNDAIHYLHHKAVNGRVRDAKNERVKIDYFRALVYAISTANNVYRDKQLDKLERDVEMLKSGLRFQNETQSSSNVDEEKMKEIEKIDAKIDKMLEKG